MSGATREPVEDDRAVDLGFLGWVLGRVRYLRLVRLMTDEVAVYQVHRGVAGRSGRLWLRLPLRSWRPALLMGIATALSPTPIP